ncbi:MAG TPA: AtpZ/AtpI family protein [Alphaproteobacteria bacterium]|nr:AtpZ/AtpI family protein [Alphaproteobacteria bacterium]HNS45260.1 AtpZ/AtpI family protein [Alphaproteobacteria bacterium]
MTDDLKTLQEKLKKLKADTSSGKQLSKEDDKNDLGKAYELIATPIVAGGIGAGIDHLFGTSPAFFIILAVLGVLAGFWAIYKAEQKSD